MFKKAGLILCLVIGVGLICISGNSIADDSVTQALLLAGNGNGGSGDNGGYGPGDGTGNGGEGPGDGSGYGAPDGAGDCSNG